MRKIIAIYLILMLAACSSKKEGNMIVQGNIKGLKKGTLYLQKMKDTLLISVDSVKVFGAGAFKLTDNVESPVIYYLTFDGNTTDKRILFFGNKGTITINDNIEVFGIAPEITGSENQTIFNNFLKINNGFNNQNLEFIKQDFEAKKSQNVNLQEQIRKDYNRMVRRRYLFTTNFALANSDSDVAPYLALTELYNANIKLLDTINKSLTPKVKASDYGKRLDKFIEEIKSKEK
ncbi:DUF4369 domain-containing protein [uncultured Polaribacter sp.]|uniref:DUF4369 domain-containing protein n=1 Tax=uncultured Polaribacter sp. TaxID=174711 RepID=UPI00261288C0|nr:DUF4369 domain-containing protein [uncultured Polaribacter sp.]